MYNLCLKFRRFSPSDGCGSLVGNDRSRTSAMLFDVKYLARPTIRPYNRLCVSVSTFLYPSHTMPAATTPSKLRRTSRARSLSLCTPKSLNSHPVDRLYQAPVFETPEPRSAPRPNLTQKRSGLFSNMPLLAPYPSPETFVPHTQPHSSHSPHSTSTSARLRATNGTAERASTWLTCMELSLQFTAARTGFRARSINEALMLADNEKARTRFKSEKFAELYETLTALKEQIIKCRDSPRAFQNYREDFHAGTQSTVGSHGEVKSREGQDMVSLVDEALSIAKELQIAEQEKEEGD